MRATTLSAFVVLATLLLTACAGDEPPTTASAGTPPSNTTSDPPASGLYIALGDSLSAGVGASSPAMTLVELVHQSLGTQVELLNFGHSGDTSDDLLRHGHLGQAVDAIEDHNGDNDKSNDVRLVTLEIGGNDLLGIYFSLVQTGICPDKETALAKAECTQALRDALDGFRPNLDAAISQLQTASPDMPIVVMTLYNPFDYLGALGELGVLSLDGQAGTDFPEGLNDIIRSIAAGHQGVAVADVYSAFQGKTASLISSDFIHPNDAGYRTMADAIIGVLDR